MSQQQGGAGRERLTAGQYAAMVVVDHNGPVTPRDLAYHHFSGGVDASRAMLARLERRKLVEATYTGHHRGRGRAFVTTERGRAAIAAHTPDDAEEASS